MGLLCMSWEFTPLDKRLFNMSFLENPSLIFGGLLRWLRKHTPLSFWDTLGFDWRDLWLTPLISSKSLLCDWILWTSGLSKVLAESCTAAHKAFSLEHDFLTGNLSILASFPSKTGRELRNYQVLLSFCLTVLLSNSSVSAHSFP